MKLLLIISLFFISCKSAQEPLSIKYSVNVPESIEEKLTEHKKHGGTYEIDAVETYKAKHYQGWKECIHIYTLNRNLTQTSQPSLKQESSFYRVAETDGFNQCKTIIFQKEKLYGKDQVLKYLKPISEKYTKEQLKELDTP